MKCDHILCSKNEYFGEPKCTDKEMWNKCPIRKLLVKDQEKIEDIQKIRFEFFDNAEPDLRHISDALDNDLMRTANMPRRTTKVQEIEVLELYDKEGNVITVSKNDVDILNTYFKDR